MTDSIKDILHVPIEGRTPEEQAEIYLYYVACSRARFKLNNAIHLPKAKKIDYFKERENRYQFEEELNIRLDPSIQEFINNIDLEEEVRVW